MGPDVAARSARHVAFAVVEALLVAAFLATLLFLLAPVYRPADWFAGGAEAAPPNKGVVTVADGVFGGTTTAYANPGGDDAWVFAECAQNGTVVFQQYSRVDPATNTATLVLGPTPLWSSGPADCRAEEGYFFKMTRWRTLAETTFSVSG